jgi:nucleotide-binding universal stress UspA family protein
MYDDILVPTDGSAGTEKALDHAVAAATAHEATVHSLYVVDRRLYRAAAAETTAEIKRSLEEEGEVALDDVRVRVEEEGRDCVTAVIDGIPHREILDYVDRAAVDLVVMGTHGRTGPERIANLGSTTERVVEDGSVPVLVVNIE